VRAGWAVFAHPDYLEAKQCPGEMLIEGLRPQHHRRRSRPGASLVAARAQPMGQSVEATALPAVRLHAFAESFAPRTATPTICQSSIAELPSALETIAAEIAGVLP